jgi:hypothetical protein
MTKNKDKIYVLSIQYGLGENRYLFKSISKEGLIRFRNEMKRYGKGIPDERVSRSQIRLMTRKELRELQSEFSTFKAIWI